MNPSPAYNTRERCRLGCWIAPTNGCSIQSFSSEKSISWKTKPFYVVCIKVQRPTFDNEFYRAWLFRKVLGSYKIARQETISISDNFLQKALNHDAGNNFGKQTRWVGKEIISGKFLPNEVTFCLKNSIERFKLYQK